MSFMQFHADIRDINLTYLMLAQQMIREDRAAAIFRLGISQNMVDVIDKLTPPQVIKMASSNILLCRFRFDENLLLNMLTDYSKDRLMADAHTTIMMAGQGVEDLVPERGDARKLVFSGSESRRQELLFA
ncbi:MAG TPA: flagellar transcriptional regulator FlhD [Gallionella sp.]|nr:flagellar transcriptional regulator FlhD [Gallionella sp.]